LGGKNGPFLIVGDYATGKEDYDGMVFLSIKHTVYITLDEINLLCKEVNCIMIEMLL